MADAEILTLTDFLLARIAEDAEFATMHRGDDWHVDGRSWRADESRPVLVGGGKILATFHEDEEASAPDHIARWNPTRVLAECEAKRRIVEMSDWEGEKDSIRGRIFGPSADLAFQKGIEAAIRLLALPYADHPDYREEWRRGLG